MKQGILAVRDWIIHHVKLINDQPDEDTPATFRRESSSIGDSVHGIDTAQVRSTGAATTSYTDVMTVELDRGVAGKTRACEVLQRASTGGLQTSVNFVSEHSARFTGIVTPALPLVDVSPPANVVHWTAMNASGTSAPRSLVASIQTGTMNGRPFALRSERSSAK